MPTPEDIRKAKEVILAIVEESNGEMAGATRLYKAFYFAHLFHFERREGFLSDYPIARLPRGPGIDNASQLFSGLTQNGRLEINVKMNGPFEEMQFRIPRNHQKANLTEEERESIRDALAWIGNDSASQVSSRSHDYSNTWHDRRNGAILNIYADILDDPEYEQMKKQQKSIKERLNAARRRRQH